MLKGSYTGDSVYLCGYEHTATYNEQQCLKLHELQVGELQSAKDKGGDILGDDRYVLGLYTEQIQRALAGAGCFAEELATTWGVYPVNGSSACAVDFCDGDSYSYGYDGASS